MRIVTWNVGRLYRAGSLTGEARKLARYKLDLVGVQEVVWEKGSRVRKGIIILSMEKKKKTINWE